MKFLAPLCFGLALITGAPAAPAAQCAIPGIFGQPLPGCPAASWFGLAIDGIATNRRMVDERHQSRVPLHRRRSLPSGWRHVECP